MASEPYCLTYKDLFERILWDLAKEGVHSTDSGSYSTPYVYNAMDGKLPQHLEPAYKTVDKDFEVGTYHCSCVMAIDVEDDEAVCKPEIKGQITKTVRKKFSVAAHKPEANYYCPTGYDPEDLKHIPTDVLEGREGYTVLDLGSGAGIDCFIAAKRLGKSGKVIGIDMTDEMIEKAGNAAIKVTESLGYNIVEFRKGELTSLPVEDSSVDLVISNCVVNLTEDKTTVMNEVFRVLKPGGKFVISDIVSDKPVPGYMKRDRELWAACLSGALTDKRFKESADEAGLINVELKRNYLYKSVEYINFYSVTLKGEKPKN